MGNVFDIAEKLSLFVALVSFNIAFFGFERFCFALIPKLFTLADAYFDFYVLSRKVHREGNERIALFADLHKELHNLFFVHEQLAVAQRVEIENITFFIRAYVYTGGEKLAFFDIAI